jgi:hypothetical protein
MVFHQACLIILSATFVWCSPLPQQSGVELDEIYQAYSPGQYANEGQTVIRTVPRLVTSKNGHVLRAIPASALKRVRVAGPQQYQQYAVESPVEFAHTVPAVSTLRTNAALAQQQQPVYYVQRAPQVQQPQRQVYKGAAAPQAKPLKQSSEESEEEYPGDPNPQYNFSFDVKDDDLTNYQNRQEERDGGVVKGSYSVIDPDGYVRTVTYTADSKNGFQAKVTREPTDVKIKFPAPTESPEEQPQQQPQYQHRTKVPSLRTQQFAQYPDTVQRYSPVAYSPHQQPQQIYASGSAGGQPTYVLRRVPSGGSPRVVKVIRRAIVH